MGKKTERLKTASITGELSPVRQPCEGFNFTSLTTRPAAKYLYTVCWSEVNTWSIHRDIAG